MKIEFDVMTDSPLLIADAIIEREISEHFSVTNPKSLYAARECIRTIGLALVNYAESMDRIDERSKQ